MELEHNYIKQRLEFVTPKLELEERTVLMSLDRWPQGREGYADSHSLSVHQYYELS